MLHGACMVLGPGLGVDCMHCCTGACTALVRICMVVVSPPCVMLRFYARMRVYGKFARVVTFSVTKDVGLSWGKLVLVCTLILIMVPTKCCPKCSTRVHVRKAGCVCGHIFVMKWIKTVTVPWRCTTSQKFWDCPLDHHAYTQTMHTCINMHIRRGLCTMVLSLLLMYYVYVTSGPSLLTQSTNSMIQSLAKGLPPGHCHNRKVADNFAVADSLGLLWCYGETSKVYWRLWVATCSLFYLRKMAIRMPQDRCQRVLNFQNFLGSITQTPRWLWANAHSIVAPSPLLLPLGRGFNMAWPPQKSSSGLGLPS